MPKQISSDGGTHPCIRYGELYTIYGEVITEIISKTSVPAENLFFGEPNDVIIPSSGETKEDIATAACVVPGGIALGGDLNVLRSRENGVFLSYYLNGPLRTKVARVAQGDSVVHLYPHQIDKLPISVPPRDEQQKIADCLSSLDTCIGMETRKLDALKAHKQGLMQQLFPAEGQHLPRLRFLGFEGGWERHELSELAQLKNGYAFKSSTYTESGEYCMVTIANVQSGHLNLEPIKRISDIPRDMQSHQKLNIGDILISMTGNVGRVCKVDVGNLLLNQRVGKLVPYKIDPAFFYHILQDDNFRAAMQLKAAGGAQGNLSSGDIAGYMLCHPSLISEQQKIADCLSSLDTLIVAQSCRIAALARHKKGLMQSLFPALGAHAA